MAIAGVSGGPTPWWQLPEYNKGGVSSRTNLEQSAPPGYEYDPVKMAYVRTPTSAGTRVNEYTTAALGGGFGSPSLSGLQTAAGIGGAAGVGGVGGVGGPVGADTGVEDIAPIDMTQANSAIFGKAKDTAGKLGRASIESLRGLLGETGQLGGGAESQATREIGETALGTLGDVNRQQAITSAGQALDVAKTNQATRLAERGQNINAQEANARLALAQTQLQFQQAQMQANQQLSLLKLALSQVPQMSESLY